MFQFSLIEVIRKNFKDVSKDIKATIIEKKIIIVLFYLRNYFPYLITRIGGEGKLDKN